MQLQTQQNPANWKVPAATHKDNLQTVLLSWWKHQTTLASILPQKNVQDATGLLWWPNPPIACILFANTLCHAGNPLCTLSCQESLCQVGIKTQKSKLRIYLIQNLQSDCLVSGLVPVVQLINRPASLSTGRSVLLGLFWFLRLVRLVSVLSVQFPIADRFAVFLRSAAFHVEIHLTLEKCSTCFNSY